MTYKDVDLMLEEGEGFELEFKRKVPGKEKIAKTLIAFANTRGGTILFGVDDDKRIVGVESEKEEIELIQNAGRYFCDPPIEPELEVVPYHGRDVIAAIVHESDTKPHELLAKGNGEEISARVFIRVNANTVVASKEVVRVLQAESGTAAPLRIIIGDIERRLFDHLDAHQRITVKQFAELVNISRRRASRTLVNLVRAGVIRIHTHEKEDFYTRAFE
ncbi:MAG: putative DNA binding domain-containing protein [Ignavibacteriales bacterium]|nr:putative DNA binding domain-containing protein [Ignavibacteriales bacterium]